MKNQIIIIGTGLAGYMLAKEIRKLDTEVSLKMITRSDGTFYSKPLLSTSLTAKRDIAKLATADVSAMSQQLHAEIRVATFVNKINIEDNTIEIEGGEKISYDKLILATGSEVIPAPLMGDAVSEILSVNDLEDYAVFYETIKGKKSIAIMGAGLVGCEFANDLLNSGYEVHVIDPSLYPLQRLLPERLGRILEETLAANGLSWHFGKLVTQIDKEDRGYKLTLSEQGNLHVDVVMSAIGLRPHKELANISGIKTNYGIWVDEYLQTSAKDVYALGDCAEVNGQVLFFVAPLMQCAQALAKTLMGTQTKVIYPVMPVVLKTSGCPIIVASPPRDSIGEWKIEGEGNDLKALYYNQQKKLCGFALTGKMVVEKNKLLEEIEGKKKLLSSQVLMKRL